MKSSTPLAVAVALAALLLLVWALWPTPDPGAPEPDPRRVAAKRAAARPMRPLRSRPLGERRAADASSDAAGSGAESSRAEAGADAATPERQTRRQRALAKRELARARATARAAATAAPGEPQTSVEDEPADGAISGAPPQINFEPEPGSPFEGMSQEDLLEYIVALRRLRDSGALRRVPPEDYWRIMEIMPESRGLQDADRIMQQLFGIGIGEWLVRNRAPDSFSLQ